MPFRGGFFPFEREPDLALPEEEEEEEEEEETAAGVLVDSKTTSPNSATAVTWVACFLPSCWCFLGIMGAGEAVGVLSTEEVGGKLSRLLRIPFTFLLNSFCFEGELNNFVVESSSFMASASITGDLP